ncbi:DMT family transporter [Anaerobacillus sp. MEB173]|uniref:DMT family transporter n=1 Tax=Anaerobacillus sp. MEB173 TaxID=3383345 RepID=UPI003F9186F7
MTRSYLLLIFTVLFYSGNILIGKAINDLPPITITLIRCLIAFIILLPISIREIRVHKQLWRKEWKPLVWLSLTGIVLFNSLLYGSLQFTSSTNVAIIEAITPVFTILLGITLLKERLNRLQWAGILLSIIGAIWVISKGSLQVILQLQFNLGDLIALFAVVSWAVYSILVKQHSYKFPVYGGIAAMLLIAIIFLVPLASVEWSRDLLDLFNLKMIMGLLYLGIFPSILALMFWNRAVADIGPSRASIFLNLLPVFTIIGAVLFLGETVTIVQLLGGVIVIAGVFLSTRGKSKEPLKEEYKEKNCS